MVKTSVTTILFSWFLLSVSEVNYCIGFSNTLSLATWKSYSSVRQSRNNAPGRKSKPPNVFSPMKDACHRSMKSSSIIMDRLLTAVPPDIEAEVLTGLAHVTLDFTSFLPSSSASKIILMRLSAVIGRIFVISADYLPDHSMLPEELAVQLVLLFIAMKDVTTYLSELPKASGDNVSNATSTTVSLKDIF